MTQKTKLEIIGPYTPEHEGPFCTRSGIPVDLRISDGRGYYPLIGYIGDSVSAFCWRANGLDIDGNPRPNDLMNAREVPVAREFWVNEYADRSFRTSALWPSLLEAQKLAIGAAFIRTIHVREVLPGEDA
ncbi:MAG: hypothetical protein ABF567_02845 [Acetobacter okinawensis]